MPASFNAPPKTIPRLFLIDAYALIYRAFFAFVARPLISSRGENTSTPFGFTQFLERVFTELGPDYLAVVFDAGSSFREEEYPAYKATREKMPDELASSMPRIRAIIEAYRIPMIALDGYEADDVIGTLAVQAQGQGIEAVIVSGDKDFYQLVSERIHLLNPGRGGATGVEAEFVDESNAGEKFGLPPGQVADYLALIGDSSDNIPGAPGIGPKTALGLLQTYGSVQAVLEHASEVSAKRVRESLLANADAVRLSRRLVGIHTDLPVTLDLEALRVQEPDHAALRDLFVDLEFRKLAEVYAGRAQESGAPPPTADSAAPTQAIVYQLLTDEGEIAQLAERIAAQGWVALHTETPSRDPMRGRLVGLSLALEAGEAFYLPFAHSATPAAPELDFQPVSIPNLPGLDSAAIAPLIRVLEDPAIRKVGANLKHDLIVLERAGVSLRGLWFDTTVASYVLDPGRRAHGIDALAVDLLRRKTITYEEVTGKGKSQVTFAEVALEAARDYACQDAECALHIYRRFEPELASTSLEPLFHELEMPLVPVLARMEMNGIKIDVPFFRETGSRFARELDQIQSEVFKLAGAPFNLNSTLQLREVLFDRLGLPVLKRTKTGPSTDVTVLEELAAEGHQVPRLLMEYRELEKLRGTYVDALPKLVHPETGRIHTSFNQTVATTGRLSSSDPNLQNIPIRTSLGREIRKGFVADEGFLLLGVDYSQIELRILAHFSGDEAFLEAFKKGIDVHRQTASVIFGVPIEEVTSEMRGQAKTINFATLYGQGSFSLARQLGIPRDEAQRFINQYFERFSGVRRYLDEQVAMARDKGYVETLLGRRRYIPELRSGNWGIRQFGERVAQNTPIQGTAADLIKKAMIDVHEGLASSNTGARMLLQVHDELLFEVPEGVVDEVRELVVGKMEGAVELAVPLVAESGVGRSWYEAKG
jgi:DNA polymerase-1